MNLNIKFFFKNGYCIVWISVKKFFVFIFFVYSFWVQSLMYLCFYIKNIFWKTKPLHSNTKGTLALDNSDNLIKGFNLLVQPILYIPGIDLVVAIYNHPAELWLILQSISFCLLSISASLFLICSWSSFVIDWLKIFSKSFLSFSSLFFSLSASKSNFSCSLNLNLAF